MRTKQFLILMALCAFGWSSVWAKPLKVLTTGAFKSVLMEMVSDYESRTGLKVEVKNETAGGLLKLIAAGETFDVVVLTPAALQTLSKEGKVNSASIRSVAKVGIGVAVVAGAPKPPLNSLEDFKAALASARKVAWIDPKSGGSSGIYLDKLFSKLDLNEVVRPKSVLVFGGLVAQKLVTGEADLAIHQISEILPVKGVELVGPLPEALQNYTTYGVAIGTGARQVAEAQNLVNIMLSAESKELIQRKGMLPAQE